MRPTSAYNWFDGKNGREPVSTFSGGVTVPMCIRSGGGCSGMSEKASRVRQRIVHHCQGQMIAPRIVKHVVRGDGWGHAGAWRRNNAYHGKDVGFPSGRNDKASVLSLKKQGNKTSPTLCNNAGKRGSDQKFSRDASL